MSRLLVAAALALAAPATAQTPPAPALEIADAPVPPGMVRLDRSAPIRLMVVDEIRTDRTVAGHRFPLRVDEAVVADGVTIIPIGAKAFGEVTDLTKTSGVGSKGKLSARLLYVEVPGGQAPITGERATDGGRTGGETAIGLLAAGPWALFAPGRQAKLKAGDIFTGFVAQDVLFDRATGRIASPPAPLASVTP